MHTHMPSELTEKIFCRRNWEATKKMGHKSWGYYVEKQPNFCRNPINRY